MSYCNYCGVELDHNMTYCPLCGLSVGENPVIEHELKSKQFVFKHKIMNQIDLLTGAQKRKLFLEISGIILVSGIIATLIINLIVNKKITWAQYNLVASLSAFANISFFTLWRNKPYLLIFGSFFSNALLLLLLDLLSSNLGWGTKLGIPILISLYTLIIVVLWLIRISHQQGFNILAIIIITIGIFLICIEVFVSLYLNNTIKLGWSIIAVSCMLPISALLFFVHYRLKAGIELHRFFHI